MSKPVSNYLRDRALYRMGLWRTPEYPKPWALMALSVRDRIVAHVFLNIDTIPSAKESANNE